MKNIFYYKTDIGQIGIAEEDNKITNLFFFNEEQDENKFYINETGVLKEASHQLYSYLSGDLKAFSLPLEPLGTSFMKKVWARLCEIPYGKTKSYKEIAEEIGNIKACRAVGQANNKNPIPIFIPCHRVIGKNGNLIGYRSGVEMKNKLLSVEQYYENI